MLRHFWNSAIRSLLRNKSTTVINIIGLSISIATFLALVGYVDYQFSYDRFIPDSENVYRLDYYEFQENDPVLQTARSHSRATVLLKEYVPQVKAVTRLYKENCLIFNEQTKITDQKVLWVDSTFFQVFNLPLIEGSPSKCLNAPNSMVISTSQAIAYFGEEDPVGKTLFFNEHLPFVITGVFKDLPKNTSIDFDFLLSWTTLTNYGWTQRDGDFNYPWVFTYILLNENTDLPKVNAAVERLAMNHVTTLEKRNHKGKYKIRPYNKIHFGSKLSGELEPGANIVLLYALFSIAVFILIAAWMNYINLSLVKSIERAEEIGVRKVFGANSRIITAQFMTEALLIAIVTSIAGFMIYKFFTQSIPGLFFEGLQFFGSSSITWFLYVVLIIVGTMLVSAYPAYFIYKFKPTAILKNKLGPENGPAFIYKTLIFFQLFLAVVLVGISLVTSRQMRYIRNFDIGFNHDQTISLRGPASTNSDSLRYNRFVCFRNEVLQHPQFIAATASMNIPGEELRWHDESIHAIGGNNDKKQSFWVGWADEGYLGTFGLTLINGRNFQPREFGNNCLINEEGAKSLGYANSKDAVNTEIINSEGKKFQIIGVIKNFHHESIRKPIEPMVIYYLHPFEFGYYTVRLNSNEGDFLKRLNKIWNKHYPNDPFVYYFMDSFFARQYQEDELFGKLVGLFSIVSILIAGLGLYGIASLTVARRTKEIGIRKVLGASVTNILFLISRDYITLLLLATATAVPISYLLIDKWLESFTYHFLVSWWLLVFPGAIIITITLIILLGKSIRAALANPVDSLRAE
jgi:putative ABC transport system permease protein